MSVVIDEALAAITAQQPKERSTVWMAGEQLKDMIRHDEAAAEIVLADLRGNAQMTLAAAEKKIAERARKNKVGGSGCVSPAEAEEILREFFGLGAAGAEDARPATHRPALTARWGPGGSRW